MYLYDLIFLVEAVTLGLVGGRGIGITDLYNVEAAEIVFVVCAFRNSTA